MQKIMRSLIFLPILFCFTSIVGQEISEQLCNNVFNSVTKSLKPTKIYRQKVYSCYCDFEFTTIEKDTILVSIEKYKTENESHKSLIDSLEQYVGFKENAFPKTLKQKESWDEAIIYEENNDNFLLLRKGKYVIKMFSNKIETLITLEKILSEIKFE